MTYTSIERSLGFSVPVTYLTLIENYDYVANPLIATLAVTNKVGAYTCRIIFINGQSRGLDTNSDFSKLIYIVLVNYQISLCMSLAHIKEKPCILM